MWTRRRFLMLAGVGGVSKLIQQPSLVYAYPQSPMQASSHWLNHPRFAYGWWLMTPNTSTATAWGDLLRNIRASFVNMPTPGSTTDGPYRPTLRPGGYADVRIDGVGGHVFIPGTFNDPTTVTFALWCKINAIGNSGSDLIAIRNSVTLRMEVANGQLWGIYRHAGGTRAVNSTSTTYADGVWRHYAYVCAPALSRQELYVNGQLAGTAGTASDAITYTGDGTDTYIGKQPISVNWHLTGFVDDVRVYGRALSATEVRFLYQDSRAGYPQLLDTRSFLAYKAAIAYRVRRGGMIW